MSLCSNPYCCPINNCPKNHFAKGKPKTLTLCKLDEQCLYSNCIYYHPNRSIESCFSDCVNWYCKKLHRSHRPIYHRPLNNLFVTDSFLIESICSYLNFSEIHNFLQTCSSLPKLFPHDSASWMTRLRMQKKMCIQSKILSNFYYWSPIEITSVKLQTSRLLVCSGHFTHSYYSPADLVNNYAPMETKLYPRWLSETNSFTKFSLGYREPYTKKGYCHATDEYGYWREAYIDNDVIQLSIGKMMVSIPLKGNLARITCPSLRYIKSWKDQLQTNDQIYIVMNQIKYNAKIFDIRDDRFIVLVDKSGVWEKIILDKNSQYIQPYHTPYPNFKKDHYIFNSRYFTHQSGIKTDTAKEVILTIHKNSGIHSMEFLDWSYESINCANLE